MFDICQNKFGFYLNIVFLCLIVLLFSCIEKGKLIQIKEVKIATNYLTQHPDSVLYMDYQESLSKGFVIPSIRQTNNGMFNFSFNIQSTAKENRKLYYKIYYQNETYKFKEITSDNLENIQADENFYGSWSDTSIGFKAIENSGIVNDSFQILGNPRNEKRYFGENIDKPKVTLEMIEEQKKKVRESIEWSATTREKAKNNKISYENQVYLEAKWYLSNQKSEYSENNRWKRNPRVGNYSFLIVITDSEGLKQIPEYITNIEKTDPQRNRFVNPFYYFLYSDAKSNTHIQSYYQAKFINLKAKPGIENGIYINAESIENPNTKSISSRLDCGNTEQLYKNANFEQFFHAYIRTTQLKNIPMVYDVVNENYTRNDYDRNAKSDSNQRTKDFINITDCPCKTIAVDSQRKAIHLYNPGNTKRPYSKENVGVKTRNGLTYGKYRLKIKFPPQLSRDNVWNGITNAFWLIHQSLADWNKRRICENKGYLGEDPKAPGKKETSYSEIDIEIVKTSPFWPKSSYQNQSKIAYKEEISSMNDNVVVALTNWDLACKDATKFNKGVHQITYQNQDFILHRWDDWYKALTIRNTVKHSDMNNLPYYYFEIEWKPEEIIWRMGANPDKLQTIGYMNNTVTNIPNNQMVAVITQEFHHDWWPPQPYSQKNIPYPKSNIDGWIYELEIE